MAPTGLLQSPTGLCKARMSALLKPRTFSHSYWVNKLKKNWLAYFSLMDAVSKPAIEEFPSEKFQKLRWAVKSTVTQWSGRLKRKPRTFSHILKIQYFERRESDGLNYPSVRTGTPQWTIKNPPDNHERLVTVNSGNRERLVTVFYERKEWTSQWIEKVFHVRLVTKARTFGH